MADHILEQLQPPSWKPIGRHVRLDENGSVKKRRNLPLSEIISTIENDSSPRRQYYITGRVDSTIYRDDCFFDGPDIDMPVRGLRKFVAITSQIFDRAASRTTLLSAWVENDTGVKKEHQGDSNHAIAGDYGNSVIVVHRQLEGVLRLPWKPKIEPMTGTTRYYLDEEGLIDRHVEEWDVPALQAFSEAVTTGLVALWRGKKAEDKKSKHEARR